MMTKRDFEAIAQIIKSVRSDRNDLFTEALRHEIAHDIASYCRQQNPKFRSSLFATACALDTARKSVG